MLFIGGSFRKGTEATSEAGDGDMSSVQAQDRFGASRMPPLRDCASGAADRQGTGGLLERVWPFSRLDIGMVGVALFAVLVVMSRAGASGPHPPQRVIDELRRAQTQAGVAGGHRGAGPGAGGGRGGARRRARARSRGATVKVVAGAYTQALKHYQAAVAKNPKNAETQYELAGVLVKLRRHQE